MITRSIQHRTVKKFNVMRKEQQIEPRLLSAKQFATYLSFPLSTIYATVEQKKILFKRFGKKLIRFDKQEINNWIDEHYGKGYYLS